MVLLGCGKQIGFTDNDLSRIGSVRHLSTRFHTTEGGLGMLLVCVFGWLGIRGEKVPFKKYAARFTEKTLCISMWIKIRCHTTKGY